MPWRQGNGVAKKRGRMQRRCGVCKVATGSGWGLLLARKAGLVTLGKGSVGMKEGKGTVVREGMGKAVRCHAGPLSSPKTPPSHQNPSGVYPSARQSYFSGDYPYTNTFFSSQTAHGGPRLGGQSPSAGAAPSLPGLLIRRQRLLGGGHGQSPAPTQPPRPAADGYHGGL